ncbi:formate dehydrogenase accessory sulfurtransferase FdhD [Sphingobacterium cellulitidis]|uniref:Sulfur carrier protein FdhD n=1 Tax=Sphingobacterium cellulitidis TaxID=1768011 RepID=A0A8H9G052_9SPHI|nr:formate dehydrogenase accessory sulfurtransferase FdhD [Sphingobacterium soli]MBA8986981.1 FdhD protein [Sphingobacterium soli]GGE15397.1 sulfurtransferase FdhD [Sphingobacterium soli]
MKADTLKNSSIQSLDIIKVKNSSSFQFQDDVSVEEPLEIRVLYGNADERVSKNLSVTMRTPGNDPELAVGFLFTEGVLTSSDQVKSIQNPQSECSKNNENIIIVELNEGIHPQLMNVNRNFYTTSSCGVCGKGSIESIRTVNPFLKIQKENSAIELDLLYGLSDKLRTFQQNFSSTGGIHASGLFDFEGNLLGLREDVGRHNALDKLIGYAFMNNQLPLQNRILLLSGRASFELVQKAAMAGIPIIAAIGAPSSLAISLAKEFDITLLGFLGSDRFNIYHQAETLTINNLI